MSMKLTRRDFVVSGAVAGAGLMAGQPTVTTGQAPHVLVQQAGPVDDSWLYEAKRSW